MAQHPLANAKETMDAAGTRDDAPGRTRLPRIRLCWPRLLLVAMVVAPCAGSAGRLQAAALVEKLTSANIAQVPEIITQIGRYRTWADPLLKAAEAQAADGSEEQLRIRLALLPVDASEVDPVCRRLLTAKPDEVATLRDALAPHKNEILETLWTAAVQPSQRLRAAAALAAYAPNDPRWTKIQNQVADDFVAAPAVYLAAWLEALRPVREKLLAPLSGIYRDPNRTETERSLATDILADYAADHPPLLAELLMDANEKQFIVLSPKVKAAGDSALRPLLLELEKPLPSDVTADATEKQGKRLANAAVAALLAGQPERVWPLLRSGPDRRVRSYSIHRLGPLGCPADLIVRRLDQESDAAARAALILSLGEVSEQTWPIADRSAVTAKLQEIYRTADDPGLHAAAEWLLRQWGQTQWIEQTDLQRSQDKASATSDSSRARLRVRRQNEPAGRRRGQYTSTLAAQTMVVLPGPVEFSMGAPPAEVGREDDERQHVRRIGRTFAIAARPVTVSDFRQFDPKYSLTSRQAASPDCPAVNISWHQAALYCNWLSKQDGIRPEQWCYEIDTPNKTTSDQAAPNQTVRMKDKFLSLTGYRLPTEAELEYATRAGTVTSRSFGETAGLLPHYAWFTLNSGDHTWPIGRLKPNEFGLFDTLGNAYGWCQDAYEQYPKDRAGEAIPDQEGSLTVDPKAPRVLRGGSFNDQASDLRSAYRHINVPDYRSRYLGFRAAKTIAAE